MALIKTVNELQAVFPKLVSNLNEDSQLPNFDIAEIKYLVPIVGIALYNDIVTKYSADPQTLSPEEQTLVKYMQALIAATTFRDEMIINQVILTDQGWKTLQTPELGKLVGWEFKKLEAFFLDKAADAEEVLLTYLWANKASYGLWTDSEEYTKFVSLLIRTGTDFQTQYRSVYQPMRTYYQLQPVVADQQENYLAGGIGADLLKYLRDVAAPTDTEKDIVKLLKKALAYFTIKHACMQLPIQISAAGLSVGSMISDQENGETAGRQSADAGMIEKLQEDCDREGQNFLSRARNALYKYRIGNASGIAFNAAYDAGKMTGYVPPENKTSGNEDRKFFVL
jgi:hypothetical protein